MQLEVGAKTNPGRRRQNNEDAISTTIPTDLEIKEQRGALFLVADGVGGSVGGEVASSEAIRWVTESYYTSDADKVPRNLSQAIKKANEKIYLRSQDDPSLDDMATTLVAAVIRGEQLWIANVGDSRAYLIRNNAISQLSIDHSWTRDQIEAGYLTENQAKRSPYRGVITRGLGKKRTVEIDIFSPLKLLSGDALVLCSDGLTDVVQDDEIRQIATSLAPEEAVEELIGFANDRGGPDNISVIVVRANGTLESAPRLRRRWVLVLIFLALILIALLVWLFYSNPQWFQVFL